MTSHPARDHDRARAPRPVTAPAMVRHCARDEDPSRAPWSLTTRTRSSHDELPPAIESSGRLGPAMPDPKSPLSLAVDAEVKKPGVMRELLQMAKRLSRSEEEEDWKDLVAMTLLRVVNPADDPWQPGRHSFLAHMHGSMRQARHRERRKLRTKGEVYDGGVAQENTAGDTPGADDELERSRS